MKLIIAGGRHFKPTAEDEALVERVFEKYEVKEVVSGCATGADAFGEACAKSKGIPIIPFPARWDDLSLQPCKKKMRADGSYYNVLAGFNRNEQMAQYADAVLLFPGGNGTADMRKRAISHGLLILTIQDFLPDEEGVNH